MNRRYYFGIASVLCFVCLVCFSGLLANAFNIIKLYGSLKSISGGIGVSSGYLAVAFCCLGLENREKAEQLMKKFLLVLFGFYLIILVDFTLIDGSFGRNIFNILNWNRQALNEYLNESTNFVPFATVRLFINGYINNNLALGVTVANILGNFAVFMPLTLFVCIFFEKRDSFSKMFLTVLSAAVTIELLQFIFLTGSCDIDDVILNTAGAMLFYFVSKKEYVSKGISKLTFGVWKTLEK